jgi:hypothetical protein
VLGSQQQQQQFNSVLYFNVLTQQLQEPITGQHKRKENSNSDDNTERWHRDGSSTTRLPSCQRVVDDGEI